MHLQQLKLIQSAKQDVREEHHFSIDGMLKGYFVPKNGISKGKGVDLGAEPPHIKIC